MPRLKGHPEGCGCAVCRRYREELETDPRAREIDASLAEEDRFQPEPAWQDPDPTPDEPATVVEHHHHHLEEHHHHETTVRERKTTARDPKSSREDHATRRELRRLRRRQKRQGRRHGILRTIAVAIVGIWVLQSFYPELDVPLVPGIACTSPSTETISVVDAQPVFLGFGGLDSKVKDLAEEAVGAVAKKLVLTVIGGALDLAGDTVRAMVAHPPAPEDIRTGLINDVEFIGSAVGFVLGALTGEDVGDLVELHAGDAVGTPVSNGCVPCPTTDGGSRSVAVTGTGAELAARAVLAAGWSGEDAVWAVQVTGAESTFNPKARNSIGASGLFQMRLPMHAALFDGPWDDAAANARAAYRLWQRDGRDPWVSSQSRWHLFEDQARAAIAAVTRTDGDAVPVAATTDATTVDPRVGDQPGAVPTKPVALRAASFIRSQFGFDGTIGGSATSGHVSNSYHYRGLALDVMTYEDKALGQKIADYFAGPGYEAFGVDNVIFNHRIYNRPQGWHALGDRGNPTANHEDHPHIDFHEDGGTGTAPSPASTASCFTPIGGAAAAEGWRVGSFNIWGASHTKAGGDHGGAPDWDQRWPGVPHLLGKHGVSVVGFQEMQTVQLNAFERIPGWDVWGEVDNVIAWRTDLWRRVDTSVVVSPYFNGPRRFPIVQLEHRDGERVWFLNIHNPINRGGVTQATRERAVETQAAALARLEGPAVWMGDFNDKGVPADLRRHGYTVSTTGGIDYIAARGIGIGNGNRVEEAKTRGISDHVLVTSDLSVERMS